MKPVLSTKKGKGERGNMKTKKLHRALEAVVPHVEEGSQIFVLDGANYHRFRVEMGQVAHTGTHSSSHVEKGRGRLPRREGSQA
jgi:hypothetical protein